jgi:hypothetical protein
MNCQNNDCPLRKICYLAEAKEDEIKCIAVFKPCKELNRNFIGCDINPKAIEITNARLDAVS